MLTLAKRLPTISHYQKMVEKTKLPVKIHGVPTLREEDGLAMSSRNVRLTETQRKEATIIYETLEKSKRMV